MSNIPFIKFYPSDYLGDTRHLTTEQHGAYFLMLMAAWNSKRCRLPNDDAKLARIVGLGVRKWRSIKDDIMEFWTEDDKEIYQERLLFERNEAEVKRERRRSAGSAGGTAKSLKDIETDPSNASDLLEQNTKQSPSNPEPEPEPDTLSKERVEPPPEFVDTLEDGLEKVGLRGFPTSEHLEFINQLREREGVEATADEIAERYRLWTVENGKKVRDLSMSLRLWVNRERSFERESKPPWKQEIDAAQAAVAELRKEFECG